MKYLSLDSYYEGTGIRDTIADEFVEINDLKIDSLLKQRISKWKIQYDDLRFNEKLNSEIISEYDNEAIQILKELKNYPNLYKVDYYYSDYLGRRIYA